MKKTMLSIVTLILTLTMLFGVVSPTVAYAVEPTVEDGGASKAPSTSTGKEELDVGWVKIEYDTDGMTVILRPDINSLLDTSKEQLKTIARKVVDGLKTVAFDKIVNNITGGTGKLDVNNIWKTAMDAFLLKQYGKNDDDTYLQFVKDSVKDPKTFDSLTRYVVGIITTAVNFQIIGTEDLAATAEIEKSLDELIEKEVTNRINENVKKYVNDCITAYKANGTTGDAQIDKFIEEKITEKVNEAVNNYFDYRIAGATGTKPQFFDKVDAKAREVIKKAVTEEVETQHPEFTPEQKEQAITEGIDTIYNDPAKIKNEYLKPEDVDALIADMKGTILNDLTQADIDKIADEAYTLVTTDPQYKGILDEKVSEIFGVGYDETLARINACADAFVKEYDGVVKYFAANAPDIHEEDLQNLLSYIKNITVNGHQIYGIFANGVNEFNSSAIKELVKELPRPTEIQNMADDEMYLTYNFDIKTDLGDCKFYLTGRIGGGYDKVRELARIIADHVEVYVSADGYYTLRVDVPEKFAELLLKACTTSQIPDDLRQKVFAAISKNVNDVEALIRNLTFNDVMALLERINFEGILNTDFVKQYVDLTDLTNEQILAKVRQYEEYINKAISLANRLLDKVPQSVWDKVGDKTIFDVYRGDGKFAYKGTHTVNIEKILTTLSSKYGPMIASLIDIEEFTASVDLDVTFDKVNRVTYNVDGVTHRDGLLPVGADLQYFAGITATESGKPILGWVDQNGNLLTEMPDYDTVLTALIDKDFELITGAGVEKVYDGNAYTLKVLVNGSTTATFTYEWYKDGTKIATTETLDVTGVKDSGTYKCVVTVTDGFIKKTLTSNDIVVKITPKAIDVSGAKWDYKNAYEFTGADFTVTLKADTIPDGVVPTYTGNKASAIGNYTAKVTFAPVNDNYVVEGTVADLAWEIAVNFIVLPENVKWDYTDAFTYDGKAKEVKLVNLPESIVAHYEGNTATDAGTYTAKVTFTSKDGDTAIKGSVKDLSWTINPKEIDISAFEWNYKEAFVYTGNEITVVLKNLPAQVEVTYDGNMGTDAKAYTAKATVTAKNDNYKVVGTVKDLEWKITPKEIDLSKLVWNYTDALIYNGQDITVELKDLPTGIKVVYEGNTAKNAGNYTAKATVTAENANYTVTGEVKELAWTIGKLVIDFTGVAWDYENSLVYNGNEQSVVLKNLPENLPADFVITYKNNSAKNAGTYTAEVEITCASENYDITGLSVTALEWTIDKAEYDMSDVKFENLTVKFDGKLHGITVTGTLPKGVKVTYSPSYKYAGVYEITATFTGDEVNYKTIPSMTATLTISANNIVVHEDKNSDGEVYIKIESETGIPEDHKFVVGDDSHIYEGFDLPEGEYGKVLVAYDIYFAKDGVYQPVEDKFTVRILIPKDLRENENLKVIFIKDDNTCEVIDSHRDGDYMVFETNHFSTYAIVEITDKPVEEAPTNLNWLWILLAVILVIILIVVIIIIIRKKKGGDNGPEGTEAPTSDDNGGDGGAEAPTQVADVTPDDNTVSEEATAEAVAEDELKNSETLEDETTTEEEPEVEETIAEEADEPVVEVAAEDTAEVTAEEETTEQTTEQSSEEESAPEVEEEAAPVEEVPAEENVAEETTEQSSEETTEQSSEEEPAPEVVETAEEVTEAPVEETTEEAPTEEPTEEVPETVAEETTEQSSEQTTEQSSEETTEQSSEEKTEENSDVVIPVIVKDSKEETTDESSKEVPFETTEESAPVEEEKKEDANIIAPLIIIDQEEKEKLGAAAAVGKEDVEVHFRSSFESRLIQADNDVQDFYTVIKNALLSYKGVKARGSWNFESFNKGRIQCAKINIKGKTLLVYLNLDPSEYSMNKYHFSDASGKPKFDKVPLVMKVKSDRALKYTVELIEEMMKKLDIPMGKVENVDYHMPYEDINTLAARGLIKIILPSGAELAENSRLIKLDVGGIIDDAKEEQDTEN